MAFSLAGKRVAVVGMARSGIGAAKLILRLGGRALISDTQPASSFGDGFKELMAAGVEIETGGHDRILREPFDLIVLSPGVVPLPTLNNAWAARGTPVWSELELASRVNTAPWLGVTGSNGKTTTVHLLNGILRRAGLNAAMAGNVGNAWSNLLPPAPDQVFVVEVSSFQLEYSPSVKPGVGVLLNLFENHLDRHGTMEVYGELKARLFRNQSSNEAAVVNGDDQRVMRLADSFPGRLVRFGTRPDFEFWTDGRALYGRVDGQPLTVIERAELPLIGRHNELNALAAAAAAYNLGVNMDTIGDALREARSVEHRIEFIGEKRGVRYVNDSKSTNMVATQTALDAFEHAVILLFGGRPKKESFAPLARRFSNPLKAMIVFGEAASKVREELPLNLPLRFARDLKEAVEVANSLAEPGDAVLLSPGCASFDQFKDYEERGRTFKEYVEALP